MAQKFSLIISVAAFLVAWLAGLAAGVPPHAILVRSIAGAAAFFAVALAACKVSAALLDFPADIPEKEEEDDGSDHGPDAPGTGPENETT